MIRIRLPKASQPVDPGRYANRGKKDSNHKAIVDTLLFRRCDVVDLATAGDGVTDIFVFAGKVGRWYCCEIKNPQTRYGRKGLNAAQKKRLDERKWAPVYIVETVSDAVALSEGRVSGLKAVWPTGCREKA